MSIIITLTQKGLRLGTITTLALRHFNTTNVRREDPPVTRADRFSFAQAKISEALAEVQSLKEELESWRDNLPENLQGGSKADELDTAISELYEMESWLEDCEGKDVSFPSMM